MPHLIVFSHLRWDFVYQRPQHLMSRLAQHYPVIFVEEPMHDDGAPQLQRLPQEGGVDVLRPRTAVQAGGFHDDQIAVIEPLLAAYLQAQGIDDYIVWFYTPMALPLLRDLQPRAVVYDCMDELSAFKNAPRQLRQRESALIRAADVVLTGGLSLYESKRDLHPNVHCLPSAVDARHFEPDSLSPDSEGRQQALRLQGKIAGPRLGFYGVIDERIDIDLIGTVADAHPEWSLVMVGPVAKIDPQRLPRRPNIHWLGMQPYSVLPYLVADWDVCLMPFALNEATQFISPTKTLEYMAAHKPVVSTPVKDVVALYGDVVNIASSPAEFVEQCERVLDESPVEQSRRISDMLTCVSRFSWDHTADTIRGLIEEVMAAPRNGDLSHLPDQGDADTQAATKPVVIPYEVADAATTEQAAAQQLIETKRQVNAR